MPIGLAQDPQVDLDRLDAGAASLPVAQGARYGALFREGAHDFSDKVIRWATTTPLAVQTPETDPNAPQLGAGLGKIDAEEANRRYGIEGSLRFNQPVYEADAAWQSATRHRQLLDAGILARSNPTPLRDFAAGLGGSLTDPMGLTVMLSTGGLGELTAGAIGLKSAEEAAAAGATLTRLGRLANAGRGVAAPLVTGAVDNAPYVAANYGLSQATGEDYGGGDALRDIAAGAVLHTGLHLATRSAGLVLGRFRAAPGEPSAASPAPAFEPNPTPAEGVPGEVDALPSSARQGAFALALDQMAGDESVDVGRLVAQELEPPGLERLDEASTEPAMLSFRPLQPDVAVTTRGTEIPVRYGLVELEDLLTSHDDALSVNPAYPPELQPRARERAGAMARNYQLEQELNPRLLMNDVGAGSGAPIVALDGTVESGNGRVIALRRSAASGGEAYARYRAALEAAGHDVSEMKAPVLARMRDTPMTGAARSALAREMNADVTERMGAAEQARQDASRLDDGAFERLPDNAQPWSDRGFARDFIARAAPDQTGVLANADGTLSPEGARRIKAAVLQRAYEDPRLTAQILEDRDSELGKAAEALADAAPIWARMRAAAALNAIPRALDITENLVQALDLARWAKSEGIGLPELVRELTGQGDMFTGSALSADTLKMLKLLFGEQLKALAPKAAQALKDYARQALKVAPGKDMFGKAADIDTARQILANVAQKFRTGDAGPVDIVRPPGPSKGAETGPVVDLTPPEPKAKEAPAAEGDGEAAKPAKVSGDQAIAADPELKALLDDTLKLEAENGVTPEIPEAQDPNTLAEAIRAAAVCLAEES